MRERSSAGYDDLGRNLKLLCGHYRSVAEVCRRVGINRQQFNKYLGGQTQPSMHNLRRIADFFGVDEAEIFLPHESFTRNVLSKPAATDVPRAVQSYFSRSKSALARSQKEMERYCGYYYSYFRSPAWPGGIVRDLYVIHQDAEYSYTKSIERLYWRDRPRQNQFVYKIKGMALHENNRIFLFEHQEDWNSMYSLTLLYPSHRSRITLLSGLLLSVSSGSGRRPFATRIVFEYLGKNPDVKQALAGCGVYRQDSDEIGEDIKRAISNAVSSEEAALTAMEI